MTVLYCHNCNIDGYTHAQKDNTTVVLVTETSKEGVSGTPATV